MAELEIMYLGKKGSVRIKPDYLPEPLIFGGHGHKATIREDLGKRLIRDNPKMFMVTRRITEEPALSEEAKQALFSEEGLEGPTSETKPPSRMNKAELKDYAFTTFGLVLDPDEMTKKIMLSAIAEAEQE